MKLYNIQCMDAVEYLECLHSESVDLLITDYPYPELEKYRKIGTTTRLKKSDGSSNEWFPIFPDDRFPELLDAIKRVMVRNSHVYFFCNYEAMFKIQRIVDQVGGLRLWNVISWYKVAIGMGFHYRNVCEYILFYEIGKRKLNSNSVPNHIEAKRVYRGYPTQKPVSVSEVLIKQSSNVGELVCDPFCGSASTGIAALKHDRLFTGCDIKKSAVDLSRARLNEYLDSFEDTQQTEIEGT